jgi:SM-20-related protein
MWAKSAHLTDIDPTLWEGRANALAGPGYVVIDGFLGAGHARAARSELSGRYDRGAFRPARVGRGPGARLDSTTRSDQILWFTGGGGADSAAVVPPGVALYLRAIDGVRLELNRLCYLGLREIECHGARYGAGDGYVAHVDAFAGTSDRAMSFAYFLNPAWCPADGGRLVVHAKPPEAVEPRLDRLVLFRSADVLHEVEACHATRWSLTGWMRR